MEDKHINNPKSPKFYINRYIKENIKSIQNKNIVDFPTGNGITAKLLLDAGANVFPFDLFPEYYRLTSPECKYADISKGIPLPNEFADYVFCQEGIEHFPDQLNALKEFSRILKPGGRLIITTPSYSNLAARFSYLLFESETNKQMPPNEINDIWMDSNADIYFGHIFLIGIQKLRVLATLSGFNITELKYLRLSKSSLLLFPLFYIPILISSHLRYRKNLRKNPEIKLEVKKKVYLEQLKINCSIKNLLNHHTFIEFEKSSISPNGIPYKKNQIVDFNSLT